MKRTTNNVGRHAVIMGGSISGLCCAAAIAPCFDAITIVDKDKQPPALGTVPLFSMGRSQTPQDQHIHLLLKQGSDTMESFLPGFCERLKKQGGAFVFNITRDMTMRLHNRWMKNIDSPYLDSLFTTRPMIEQTLREMVLERYPHITMKWNTRVQSYDVTGAAGEEPYVNHIVLDDNTMLDADLYIDAMGFSSPTPRLLHVHLPSSAASVDAPSPIVPIPTLCVDMQLRYSTSVFRTPESLFSKTNCKRVYVKPSETKRGGVFIQSPEGITLVTLMGYHDMRPDLCVHDEKTFMDYVSHVNALTMPDMDIVSTFFGTPTAPEAKLEFLLGPKPFTVSTQMMKRWDLCDATPHNLIMMGDAYCRFDPAFGQGMTVSALEAAHIRNSLCVKPGLFQWISSWFFGSKGIRTRVSSKTIMSGFYPIAIVPFLIDTVEAWKYPNDTVGWKPPMLHVWHRLLEWVLDACAKHGHVYEALMMIFTMVSYTTMIQPRNLLRILHN